MMIHSDQNLSSTAVENDEEYVGIRNSSFSTIDPSFTSIDGSPMIASPWNQPIANSPWPNFQDPQTLPQNRLIGSLFREEGHVYSLAATRDLLYTGSDSKNIHVWKNMKEFSTFKSNSGLVKAIVISGAKIFTGHQDGRIRVWKVNDPKKPRTYKRTGTLPTFMDVFKSLIKQNRRSPLRIKHCDAISCLSMDEEHGLLYSSSWDRTFKVWRIRNSKCLESVEAHDDAVNSVVVSGFGGMIFTGSADGTVKLWRREMTAGEATKHALVDTLLKQESAVTALAVGGLGSMVYCGSSDGLLNFWAHEKQQLNHGGVLKGHKLAVLCVETAGNLVFSGSADKTICMWRREGIIHTRLSVLTGHTGPVKCLAVDKDRESAAGDQRWVVYSGSLDKSVKVWSVSELAPDLHHMAMVQEGGHQLGIHTLH
ncbi:hypothetical protein U1Q18_016210 [Sarracenia purpurea var. burkii]